MKKERGRPRKNKDTTTIRVLRSTAANLNRLKGTKTHSEFLDETFSGEVCYVLDDHLLKDLALARGHVILKAAKSGKPEAWPMIVLPLRRDSGA